MLLHEPVKYIVYIKESTSLIFKLGSPCDPPDFEHFCDFVRFPWWSKSLKLLVKTSFALVSVYGLTVRCWNFIILFTDDSPRQTDRFHFTDIAQLCFDNKEIWLLEKGCK